jgi:surface protein
MRGMFSYATAFNQTIGNWNVGKVTNMWLMFSSATKFNQDLCAWYNKLLSLPNVTNMFTRSGCTSQAAPNISSKTSFCQSCSCSAGKLFSIV